ncbi:MAG: hypothetical protein AAF074_15680 [Pseudomonadota bacterium]
MHHPASRPTDRAAAPFAPPRRPRGWPTAALLAAVAAFAAFILANLAHYSFGRDQGIYAMVAEAFFHGGAPYADAWDFKTPGIFFVFAAARALFGIGETGMRIFEILSFLAMGGGFWLISRRVIDGRAALLAFAIAVFGLTIVGFWHVTQPESFGAVVLSFAILLAMPMRPGPARMAAWAGSAALYTFAALLKPTLGGGILVTFGFVVWQVAQAEGWRALWRPTAAFFVGGASMLGATAAYLVASGAWDAFYDALFVFAPQYTAVSYTDTSFGQLVLDTLSEFVRTWALPPVGILALLVLGMRDPARRAITLHILGVVAVILLGVALQAKLFHYHFATAAALSALPAAWGFWLVWERVAGYRIALPLCLVLAVPLLGATNEARKFWIETRQRVAMLTMPAEDAARRDAQLYKLWTTDTQANRDAAAWLKAEAPEGSTLFVWGFEPIIYYYSGLRPHNRYIYNVPMRARWSQETARAEFLAGLEAAPPWAIVVQENDKLPWVLGDPRGSREVLEEEFGALRDALGADYMLSETFGPLQIYTRNAPG